MMKKLGLSRLKIRDKLLAMLTVVAGLSVSAFGLVEYREAKEALQKEVFQRLTAAREFKAQQLENSFRIISDQVASFAGSLTAIEGLKSFTAGFEALSTALPVTEDSDLGAFYAEEFLPRLKARSDSTEVPLESLPYMPQAPVARVLQELYISSNPYPVGEKEMLIDAGDGSSYSNVHARFHPIFADYLKRFGYYDIFLVDADSGRVVYSVFKEIDFATSLFDGPHANSGLGQAFQGALKERSKGSSTFTDYRPYVPSYGAPANFAAAPIFEGSQLLGVLVFQMPIDRIDAIATNNGAWVDVGLGKSGETYVVGSDMRMRTQSRFMIEDRDGYLEMIRRVGIEPDIVDRIERFGTSIGLQPVNSEGTQAALAGGVDTRIFPDYRGVRVLSAFRPLDIQDLRWVIMSEIDEAEAFEPITALRRRMFATFAVFLATIAFASYLFARVVTRPILDLSLKAKQLAQGDLGVEVETSGGDEISQLARSFEAMRVALRELIEGLEEKVATRTRALADSEERFRAIIENAADGIVVIDSSGTMLTCSPAAQELLGYKGYEMLGENVSMMMPEPIRSAHDNYLLKYFKTGERHVIGANREVLAQKKDGALIPVELAVAEAEIAGQQVFIGLIRDISARKEAEQVINQGYQIINQAPIKVSVHDTGGRLTLVNASFEAFHGTTFAEVVGTMAHTFDRSATAKEPAGDTEMTDPGRRTISELQIESVGGQLVDFQRIGFPVSNLDGEVVAYAHIDVDITERKKLQRELEIANKRMGDELNIGHHIQMSMIPLMFPRFPEHKDLDVWARIRPAREVGGDFYDFFFIDERYFAFVIADVSGKGVPAALLMAVAKTLTKSCAADTQSTARIVEHVNNELSENNDDCMFLTAFLGILDTCTGSLTYTNAGHNPPYLIKADGELQTLNTVHGPMIGAMGGIGYREESLDLEADEKLVLFTDGVTEAFNMEGVAYGEERLEALLEKSTNLGTKYLVEAVIEDVDEFAAGEDQSDDITLFCLRYVAWETRDDRGTIELRLSNDLSEITRALEALTEFTDRFRLPGEIREAFSIVLDDLLNNTISYAYPDDEEHLIDLVLSTDQHRFVISLTDDGSEFDPFARREPDLTDDIEGRTIGQLGIHLVKNLMDDCSYRRVGSKNVTTLMKRLKSPADS